MRILLTLVFTAATLAGRANVTIAPMARALGIESPEVVTLAAQFCPRTPAGHQVRAWSYTIGPQKFVIGLNLERADEDGHLRYVIAHELCHIRLHPAYVDQPTRMKTQEMYLRLEAEANRCAAALMSVKQSKERK